jgi:aspartyl-tRNA synthetase
MKRTQHCGELRAAHVGQKAILMGWVHARRDLGGIVFIELRDREGNTQVVFDPQHNKPSWELAQSLRSEFVVAVEGFVRKRPEGTQNLKLPTGEVELLVDHLEILNPSETPPFQLDETGSAQANEELRLQYRYLDLRRPSMTKNLKLRHRVAKAARDYFDPLQEHAGRRPRVSGTVAREPREVLCAAAVTTTVQANADGGGGGPLLPNCEVFS